jgi:hypothetical protein
MTKQYDDIVTKAAAELVKAMRKPECAASGMMPTVYAVPTTENEDGRIVVVEHGYPAPLGGVVVRPNDNNASCHEDWYTVPYDHVRSLLYWAMKSQPILPLDRGQKEPHVVSLREAPQRMLPSEEHMVYDVLLNGNPTGAIFLMTWKGVYSGCLPLPDGRFRDVQGKNIAVVRKEVARINREVKAAAQA